MINDPHSTDTGFDGVEPPPQSDPTLITWRRYAGRSDRLRIWVIVVVLYAIVIGAAIGLTHGTGTTAVIVATVVGLVFVLVVGRTLTSTKAYYAAGRTWILRSRATITRRHDRRWVRLDALTEVGAGQRQRTASVYRVITLRDADGRSVELEVADLRASPPMATLLAECLHRASKSVDVDPRIIRALRSSRPTGRTMVRPD